MMSNIINVKGIPVNPENNNNKPIIDDTDMDTQFFMESVKQENKAKYDLNGLLDLHEKIHVSDVKKIDDLERIVADTKRKIKELRQQQINDVTTLEKESKKFSQVFNKRGEYFKVHNGKRYLIRSTNSDFTITRPMEL